MADINKIIEREIGKRYRLMSVSRTSDPETGQESESLPSHIVLQRPDGTALRLYSGDTLPFTIGGQPVVVSDIGYFAKPKALSRGRLDRLTLGVEFAVPGQDGGDAVMITHGEEARFLSGGVGDWAKERAEEPIPEERHDEQYDYDGMALSAAMPMGLGIAGSINQAILDQRKIQKGLNRSAFLRHIQDLDAEGQLPGEHYDAAKEAYEGLQSESWEDSPFQEPSMADLQVQSTSGEGDNLAVVLEDTFTGNQYQYRPNAHPDEQWDYEYFEDEYDDTGPVTYDERL